MTIDGAPGPLHGLRVLDLSTTPPGAQASQLLADFGADVVHVERPGGSPLRRHAAYPFLARGKRSIVLDLHDADDRAVAVAMARGADVIVETFRPGVAARFGLDHDTIAADNPGVVHASITGFGRNGPLSGLQGYEALVIAALGGFSTVSGMVERDGPAFISVPFGAYAASQTALHGILAALHERHRSGHGQRVETSLVQGVATLGTWNWFVRVITDKYPGAFTAQPPFTDAKLPTSPIFFMLFICLTSDGRWLQFGQVRPHLFRALMRALDLEAMYEQPEWSTVPAIEDETKRAEFWEILLAAAQRKSLAEWQEIFERDHDVWAETMRRGGELLDHPQMTHLGGAITITDSERGSVRMPAALVMMDDTPAMIDMGAPRLDEHGNDIRRSPWVPRPVPAPLAGDRSGSGPLAGVTVLELGTFFAAPFGGCILADLGARVIKVESIEGEPMRSLLPFPETGAAKVMQGKESVSVDLGTAEGRTIVHRLAAQADIVLQSFRAGVATRQGIDAATLRAINPSIVYLNAPGYGMDGPCGDRPAYAPTIGAGAGFVMRNLGSSVPERADMSIAEMCDAIVRLSVSGATEFAQADGVAAITTATAMLLGLLIRDRTGVAQGMQTTMLTSAAHALGDEMVEWNARPPVPVADAELHGYGPCYRMYEASDGWFFLAAPSAEEWPRLVAALRPHVDLSGVCADSGRSCGDNDSTLAGVLGRTFATRPAAAWVELLRAHDVGAAVIDSGPPEKVLQSAEFGRAAGLLVDVEHPTFGDHPRLAPSATLSRTVATVGPGCLRGQHTRAVLDEIGYDAEQIADLLNRTIIAE